jgi:glycosyltransferase involved in cell wall biosynthesis
MVEHPRHVCYLLHPLRGLYDTYPAGWPTRCGLDHPELSALVEFLDRGGEDRALLAELFERLDGLRSREDVPAEAFALPGPLIRQVVHFLDGIGRSKPAIARSVALSSTVASRADYFPGNGPVPVAHAPTRLCGLHSGRGSYLFTVSRLDAPKRIDLLIRAMQHVRARVPLQIAGTGPQAQHLRELAAGDPRISLTGFLNDDQLAEAYAGSLAVLFAPYQEDYGYITLEAMLSGKPVITTTDSGGPTELIEDGLDGLVVDPDPAAIGGAIERLLRNRRAARRMGRAGQHRARQVSWERVVATLLDGISV